METKIETLSIFKDFYNITGARISLHDLEFNEVLSYPENLSLFCSEIQKNKDGKRKCVYADMKAFERVRESGNAYTYRCHCGLIETVAPIYNYGVLSGYFMMGQITDSDSVGTDQIPSLSSKYLDSSIADSVIGSIPKINKAVLSSYINILSVISEYMTKTNRIASKGTNLAENIIQKIHKDYREDLSINSLCETFACSRTTLINCFKEKYSMTVGAYIDFYRLKEAKIALEESNSPISVIASECGFGSQNYFTRSFKKEFGITPSEFRNKNKK